MPDQFLTSQTGQARTKKNFAKVKKKKRRKTISHAELKLKGITGMTMISFQIQKVNPSDTFKKLNLKLRFVLKYGSYTGTEWKYFL